MKLYSNGCPNCIRLKSMLDNKGILYESTDIQFLIDNGYQSIPMLEIDDKLLDFPSAVKYIHEVL